MLGDVLRHLQYIKSMCCLLGNPTMTPHNYVVFSSRFRGNQTYESMDTCAMYVVFPLPHTITLIPFTCIAIVHHMPFLHISNMIKHNITWTNVWCIGTNSHFHIHFKLRRCRTVTLMNMCWLQHRTRSYHNHQHYYNVGLHCCWYSFANNDVHCSMLNCDNHCLCILYTLNKWCCGVSTQNVLRPICLVMHPGSNKCYVMQ